MEYGNMLVGYTGSMEKNRRNKEMKFKIIRGVFEIKK